MTGRLQDKVAIITGGGQGIGQAIAQKMAADGAFVMLADINLAAAEQTAEAINASGRHQAVAIQTDITIETQVSAAVARCIAAFGRVDILVNNAGKNFYYDATTMTETDWDNALNVDLKGAWLCCKHALPAMIAQGFGAIVNIASVHARMTAPGHFPYAAAKSGLVGLTRSLALDYAKHNIRVNAICPGWVRTALVQDWFDRQPDPRATEQHVIELQPLKRIGTPTEIANLVSFIASDEASYITGAELVIDGGLSIMYAQ